MLEKNYKMPMEDVNDIDATISEVNFEDGDKVLAGNPIYSFETTKTNVEICSEDDGFIFYFKKVGQVVKVGEKVCVISEEKNFSKTIVDTDNLTKKNYTLTKKAEKFVQDNNIEVEKYNFEGIIKLSDLEEILEPKNKNIKKIIQKPDINNDFISYLFNKQSEFSKLSSEEKLKLYKKNGYEIDDSVIFKKGSIIISNKIKIGEKVIIGENTFIETASIEIGDDTRIGNGCSIVGSDIKIGDLNRIGDNVKIDISGGRNFDSDFISGKDCLLADGVYINICRKVTLGNYVAISPRAMIFTHSYWQSILDGYKANFGSIILEDNSWVGAASQLLPNVKMMSGSTLMSGSVLTTNAPLGSLLGGIPAKVIKEKNKIQYTKTQITEILSGLMSELSEYFEYLGYTVNNIAKDYYEIKLTEQKIRQLQFIYAFSTQEKTTSDILITYKKNNQISSNYYLCIEDKTINLASDYFVEEVINFFRRRGIRFYTRSLGC